MLLKLKYTQILTCINKYGLVVYPMMITSLREVTYVSSYSFQPVQLTKYQSV